MLISGKVQSLGDQKEGWLAAELGGDQSLEESAEIFDRIPIKIARGAA